MNAHCSPQQWTFQHPPSRTQLLSYWFCHYEITQLCPCEGILLIKEVKDLLKILTNCRWLYQRFGQQSRKYMEKFLPIRRWSVKLKCFWFFSISALINQSIRVPAWMALAGELGRAMAECWLLDPGKYWLKYTQNEYKYKNINRSKTALAE